MNRKGVQLSGLIFSVVIVSSLFLTLGGFYTEGASVYEVNTSLDYGEHSYFDEIYSNVSREQVNLSGGSVEQGDVSGNYWDTTITVMVDLATGKMLVNGLKLLSSSFKGVTGSLPVPDYVLNVLVAFLILGFVFAGLKALSGRMSL